MPVMTASAKVLVVDDEPYLAELVATALRYEGFDTRVADSAPDSAIIDVTDDGPGLPATVGTDPFERFVRAPAHAAAAPGSGLGLAIVRAIAEAHGGTAEIGTGRACRSAPGVTVVVRLPLALRRAIAD